MTNGLALLAHWSDQFLSSVQIRRSVRAFSEVSEMSRACHGEATNSAMSWTFRVLSRALYGEVDVMEFGFQTAWFESIRADIWRVKIQQHQPFTEPPSQRDAITRSPAVSRIADRTGCQ